MVMFPNILGLLYTITATTVVGCILMQILCVFSQKASVTNCPPDPYQGSASGPRWGTSPDPQSSFISPQ